MGLRLTPVIASRDRREARQEKQVHINLRNKRERRHVNERMGRSRREVTQMREAHSPAMMDVNPTRAAMLALSWLAAAFLVAEEPAVLVG